MRRRTIAGLILIVEVGLAAYLSLVVWLLSVWMVDDSQAFRMAPADWYVEGLRRLGPALVVSVVFGGLTYLANRQWVNPSFPGSPRLGARTAVLLAACIALWGTAGAIRFVITKPFL